MAHDFKAWPELTNNQLQVYYWDSPHKQIVDDFAGLVEKVVDGDTIHVKWKERKKPVRVRLIETQAPEMKEFGGAESKSWLEKQILGKYVTVEVDPELRVGKWGRILGRIIHLGMDVNKMSMDAGHSFSFERETSIWA
jgi:endonuclease YncB( thermonuclease family)